MIGDTFNDRNASTCSVTCIEPISAAIAEPQRAATIIPASTGPISRKIANPTAAPAKLCAPYRTRTSLVYSAKTAPLKNVVNATIGTLDTPIKLICRSSSSPSNGRVNNRRPASNSNPAHSPTNSSAASTACPIGANVASTHPVRAATP